MRNQWTLKGYRQGEPSPPHLTSLGVNNIDCSPFAPPPPIDGILIDLEFIQ